MKALIDEIAEDIGPHLLKTAEAAEALGVTARCLESWRLRGGGPEFIRLAPTGGRVRAVRYRPRALAKWLSERAVTSTSEPGPGDEHR
jgi:hypothetical protein